MAKTPTHRVRARVSRYIGDDYYGAGEVYTIEASRAERYAARGDFELLPDAPVSTPEQEQEPEPEPEAKQRTAPPNKMRAAGEDK